MALGFSMPYLTGIRNGQMFQLSGFFDMSGPCELEYGFGYMMTPILEAHTPIFIHVCRKISHGPCRNNIKQL